MSGKPSCCAGWCVRAISPRITASLPTLWATCNWKSRAKAWSATARAPRISWFAPCCELWASEKERTMRRVICSVLLFTIWGLAESTEPPRKALIRDVASVEGVRENPLLGYGIVVGLNGTGDRRQTIFTMQTLGNALQRLGVQIPTGTARVNNIAAVFVTASLPPFARSGTQLDVTVSSIGDAKSLEGGMLLLTPLRAADGEVYAAAQGPITLGGYSTGGGG